jgi:succinate dehydrogenase / fumarate reductase, cytochrome b subunit
MLGRVWQSTLGKKFLMAVTGTVLFLFVSVHMMGNLQMFLGPEVINRYAAMLQTSVEFLWPARFWLGIFALVHVTTGIALTWQNRQTRDHRYATTKLVKATLASRTMLWTGSWLALYAGYHLLHFTIGNIDLHLAELKTADGHRDVYRMVIWAFQDTRVACGYVLAMGVLCFHLSHGIVALFQSLGIKKPGYAPAIERFARLAALGLLVGFVSVPVAVQVGWLQ